MEIGWSKEVDMMRKMSLLKEPHIVEFFTAFRRGVAGSYKHYLMLEYATGGNLRQLWEKTDRSRLIPELVKASIAQLQGLANALTRAHDPETGPKFRHGDLKPENILWFKDDLSKGGIGTLKIGDWGLAKQHVDVTELRTNSTTTPPGTRLYEPPEEITGEGVNRNSLKAPGNVTKRRSRLCDVWAMGCISLEFLIWLMYGHSGQTKFRHNLMTKLHDNSRFFQIKQVQQDNQTRLVAQVHEVAVQWMDHMARDPACEVGQTALGDLLELIRTRLLVVKLPQRLATQPLLTPTDLDTSIAEDNAGPSIVIYEALSEPISQAAREPQPQPFIKRLYGAGPERALARGFQDHLQYINSDDHEDSYWFHTQPRSPPDSASTEQRQHDIEAHSDDSQYLGITGQDVTELLVTRTKRVR